MAMNFKTAKHHSTNNRVLFIAGLLGTAASVPLKNSILWTVSLVMALIGLFNLGTWSEEGTWKKLSSRERQSRILACIFCTAVLVLAGWVYLRLGSLV